MTKGPRGKKRPVHVIGNAVKIARIATGEEAEDTAPTDTKDEAAAAMGRRDGEARAEAMPP